MHAGLCDVGDDGFVGGPWEVGGFGSAVEDDGEVRVLFHLTVVGWFDVVWVH